MYRSKLKNTLEKYKDDYLDVLIELIRLDTSHIDQGIGGGREINGQIYLEKILKEIGYIDIELDYISEETIQNSIENYNEGNPGHNYDDRYNLYAKYKVENENAGTILFNGHVDTMPPGPLSLWNTNPFSPVIKDGKLIGLGSTDMKAGLVASILAVKLIKDCDIEIPNNIIFTSVVDEEGGGNGSIQAVHNAPYADVAVVCEPTNYELILSHMGFVFYRVEIVGQAHHSGSKWKGINSIEKMLKIIEALKAVEYKWLFKYKHDLLPPPNINIGIVTGGSSGATVPGYCKLEVCIHYHPVKMSFETVNEEFIEAVMEVANSDEWLKYHLPKITMFQAGGGFEMERNHPFVTVATDSFSIISEKNIEIVGSPAGCDSRLWKNIRKMPTIQFGPGRLEECHSPNEYVEIKQFYDAILFYANLILNYKKEG